MSELKTLFINTVRRLSQLFGWVMTLSYFLLIILIVIGTGMFLSSRSFSTEALVATPASDFGVLAFVITIALGVYSERWVAWVLRTHIDEAIPRLVRLGFYCVAMHIALLLCLLGLACAIVFSGGNAKNLTLDELYGFLILTLLVLFNIAPLYHAYTMTRTLAKLNQPWLQLLSLRTP